LIDSTPGLHFNRRHLDMRSLLSANFSIEEFTALL